jgi:hypothetical protein
VTGHADDPEPALAAWGGDAAVLERLGGGSRNRVWAVRVGGCRRVARDSGAARSGAALDWELDLLQELAGAGFTVPVPVPARDGRRRVGGLVVLSWLDGEPPGDERAWRLVGDELARLHRHTASRRQRPGFASTRELLTAERGGDVRLDRMPPEVVALCRAAWSRLACAPPAVVHGDPGPQKPAPPGGQGRPAGLGREPGRLPRAGPGLAAAGPAGGPPGAGPDRRRGLGGGQRLDGRARPRPPPPGRAPPPPPGNPWILIRGHVRTLDYELG